MDESVNETDMVISGCPAWVSPSGSVGAARAVCKGGQCGCVSAAPVDALGWPVRMR